MDFKQMRILAGIEELDYNSPPTASLLVLEEEPAPHVCRQRAHQDIIEEQLLGLKEPPARERAGTRARQQPRKRFTRKELATENRALRRENTELKAENEQLREHNGHLTGQIRELTEGGAPQRARAPERRGLFDEEGQFDMGPTPWDIDLTPSFAGANTGRQRGGAGRRTLGLAERLAAERRRPPRVQTPDDFRRRLPGSQAPSAVTPADEIGHLLPGPPPDFDAPPPPARSVGDSSVTRWETLDLQNEVASRPREIESSNRYASAIEEAGPITRTAESSRAPDIGRRFDGILDEAT